MKLNVNSRENVISPWRVCVRGSVVSSPAVSRLFVAEGR